MKLMYLFIWRWPRGLASIPPISSHFRTEFVQPFTEASFWIKLRQSPRIKSLFSLVPASNLVTTLKFGGHWKGLEQAKWLKLALHGVGVTSSPFFSVRHSAVWAKRCACWGDRGLAHSCLLPCIDTYHASVYLIAKASLLSHLAIPFCTCEILYCCDVYELVPVE